MSKAWISLISVLIAFGSSCLIGQAPNGTPQTIAPAQPIPIPILIKKAIVFLETDCLHDFAKDSENLKRDSILQMPSVQQVQLLVNLANIALKLERVKHKSVTELSAQDVARLVAIPTAADSPEHNADEIEWRITTLAKLNTFTDEEIASLTDKDFPLIPQDSHRGTGFLVGYPDSRLKRQPGDVGPRLFRYLVTNHHMTQPGIEYGKPCKIVRSTILLNHKADPTHASPYGETNRTDRILTWITPVDSSVDLAVAAIGFDDKQYDHVLIPTTAFVSDDEIKNHKVVEGDPVLFAGLFTQTFDQLHTLEPIVRSGSLALIPEGLLQFTLDKKPGHVYLAEVHAFGGNSGSPIFVDPTKFQGTIVAGANFKLLGVISEEVFENSDLTLTLVSSISGNIAANSGVSVVVPVSELVKLLDDPGLSAGRSQVVAQEDASPR